MAEPISTVALVVAWGWAFLAAVTADDIYKQERGFSIRSIAVFILVGIVGATIIIFLGIFA